MKQEYIAPEFELYKIWLAADVLTISNPDSGVSTGEGTGQTDPEVDPFGDPSNDP